MVHSWMITEMQSKMMEDENWNICMTYAWHRIDCHNTPSTLFYMNNMYILELYWHNVHFQKQKHKKKTKKPKQEKAFIKAYSEHQGNLAPKATFSAAISYIPYGPDSIPWSQSQGHDNNQWKVMSPALKETKDTGQFSSWGYPMQI